MDPLPVRNLYLAGVQTFPVRIQTILLLRRFPGLLTVVPVPLAVAGVIVIAVVLEFDVPVLAEQNQQQIEFAPVGVYFSRRTWPSIVGRIRLI